MNCERAESLMMDFIYGEISDEIPKDFFRHLNECEKCSGRLRDLRHLRSLIKKIPEITDSSITWKSPHGVSSMGKSRLKWYLATAAVIVLTILSLFVGLNTTFQYNRGAVTLRLGTEKQASLPEYEASLSDHKLSYKELEGILRYINYLENRQNVERVIFTEQLESLANSTLHEFSKRDKMLQWLISNYEFKSEQTTDKKQPM